VRTRIGPAAAAIVDSEGRLCRVNVIEQFTTGSVGKAMLLVAYLRRLDTIRDGLPDPPAAWDDRR